LVSHSKTAPDFDRTVDELKVAFFQIYGDKSDDVIVFRVCGGLLFVFAWVMSY
jgi:hypothetical protein